MFKYVIFSIMIVMVIFLIGCEPVVKKNLEESSQNLQESSLNESLSSNLKSNDSIRFIEIVAVTDSEKKNNIFNHIIKLSPDSNDISFNDIELNVNEKKYKFRPDGCNNLSGDWYGIKYVHKGTDYKNGFISKNDVVQLCYKILNIEYLSTMYISLDIKSVPSSLVIVNIPAELPENYYLWP